MELFEELNHQASSEADIYRPLLAFLRAKKMGGVVPPFIHKWELLPLYKLCRQALLLKEAGFIEEAGRLAFWLLQLEPFLPLWCPEKEFDEKAAAHCFFKLKEIQPVVGLGPDFNLSFVNTEKLKAALTLDGKKTSLGVIRKGKVQIRAFGPQSSDLHFGIDGNGMDGWTRTAAYDEVWMEMKHAVREEGLSLDFRFIGAKPENPLFLAFYVKAESCQVENEILKPKSLHRYQGAVKKIAFENNFLIESNEPLKIEIIPLAGSGCFWNTQFLLLYPISAFSPQISLYIC